MATCGTGKGGSDLVRGIAINIQQDVKKQADDEGNVGTRGESNLKAALKQAVFGPTLENKPEIDDPCQLQKGTHTNATDGNKDPCKDKSTDRFKVGERWKPADNGEVEDVHKEVLLPPRRLGMCTSNLENLNTNNTGFIAHHYASHSLLGDVLLTAKEEAESIIKQYKNASDNDAKCRALKASFADLGDIIRGRDLWSNESGMKEIETKLTSIFKKIKEKLTIGSTYKNDSDPYTKLRDAWWSQNRDQIWKAMTTCGETENICSTSGSGRTSGPTGSGHPNNRLGHTGSTKSRPRPAPAPRPPRPPRPSISGSSSGGATSVPYDDYIPQKLRWLTEWSEWYCKTQKKHYTDLVGACEQCKSNTTCNECTQCKAKCTEYENFVKEWNEDWKKQQEQYSEFYTKATKNGGSTTTGDENLKYLYEFLSQLHTQNTQKSGSASSGDPYGSAGGYINREAPKNICVGQTIFCNESNAKYVFQKTPDGYDKACNCTDPAAKTKKSSVPTIKCTGHKILDAAHMRHHYAKTQMETNSIDKGTGESKLKGDLSQATFKSGQKLNKDKICELDKSKHTNDKRGESQRTKGPCQGKGGKGITDEKPWAPQNSNASSGNEDVLFPPRRLDMCTSNLESLNTGYPGLTGNDVNHSFFGDVLLTAKEEAAKIIELYNSQSGSQSGAQIDDVTKCRAIKSSFADIGDIIRGRDIWSNDTGSKSMEEKFKTIFKNIHEKVDGLKAKYPNDTENTTPPYKKLREDWWNANRDKVWDAMKCDKTITCGATPLDDYIPQELRWIDEWSHQYCNQRKKLADAHLDIWIFMFWIFVGFDFEILIFLIFVGFVI
ncbi:erythrocyte membrane protein 1, PfEMP1, putative [Plasmodium sp. DRC-Itaito]|nr:erythrocyte membrane protein 1, PfEMP1, putative [Plasmodium sp. DRC-Itaito]